MCLFEDNFGRVDLLIFIVCVCVCVKAIHWMCMLDYVIMLLNITIQMLPYVPFFENLLSQSFSNKKVGMTMKDTFKKGFC